MPRKTKADKALESKIKAIDVEIQELLGTMSKYRTPPPITVNGDPEPPCWYERFLAFCKIGGAGGGGARKVWVLQKLKEARLEGKELSREDLDIPRGKWSAERKKWQWDDRYKEWSQALMRIEYLEDQKMLVESKWSVAKQIKALDEAFERIQGHFDQIMSLPLESLRPRLSDVARLGQLMLNISAERRKDARRKSDNEVEEAIATLVEYGFLPADIAAKTTLNLSEFYDAQKNTLNVPFSAIEA